MLGGLCIAAKAQTGDGTVVELRYDVTQRLYVEDPEPNTDEMVLLIGTSASRFYNYSDLLRQQKQDSIVHAATAQLGLPMGAAMEGSVVMSGQGYEVFKNLPAEGQLTYTESIGGKRYRVEEAMPAIDWQLADGDSTVADYRCQKAVAQWRGRQWTAWYTLDLPYSEGPWKLCGLPGTILAASDATGEFRFQCVAIREADSTVPIAPAAMKSEKCSGKELQAMKTKEAKDPVGFILESMGLGGMMGSGQVQVMTVGATSGQKAEVPSRTPVFMETY